MMFEVTAILKLPEHQELEPDLDTMAEIYNGYISGMTLGFPTKGDDKETVLQELVFSFNDYKDAAEFEDKLEKEYPKIQLLPMQEIL